MPQFSIWTPLPPTPTVTWARNEPDEALGCRPARLDAVDRGRRRMRLLQWLRGNDVLDRPACVLARAASRSVASEGADRRRRSIGDAPSTGFDSPGRVARRRLGAQLLLLLPRKRERRWRDLQDQARDRDHAGEPDLRQLLRNLSGRQWITYECLRP